MKRAVKHVVPVKVVKENPHDYRKTNPTLHLFYVKQGVKHLLLIDSQLQQLYDTSNFNMFGPIRALESARRNLVKNNPAYTDADEIVKSAYDMLQTLVKRSEP